MTIRRISGRDVDITLDFSLPLFLSDALINNYLLYLLTADFS